MHIVGLTTELKELTSVLVQSITIDSALPAIDWSAVLCPLLSNNVRGQFMVTLFTV